MNLSILTLAACLLACATTTHAQTTAAAEPPALSLACKACHGADGRSISPDIPHLAGQRAPYLVKQLKAFREGTRKNDLMAAMAAQLRDDDITALAAYWSSLPAAGAPTNTGAPGAVAPHPARVSRMRLPAGFPEGYSEYRRENDAKNKAVGISYANTVAWQAARAGKPLPDGSVIIVATYAAQLDAAGAPMADARGEFLPGKVQAYSGMQAASGWGDEVPALLRNGNWNYGLFTATGESRIGELQPRCLACHQPKAQQSYVFGLPALQARAK